MSSAPHATSVHCRQLLTLALGLSTIACGDLTGATGELGRVSYTLSTLYLSENSDLTQVGIITGHEQRIDTSLTSSGHDAVIDPTRIVHEVTPSSGVTITDIQDGSDIPDVNITVTESGSYDLESVLDGRMFDRVVLQFEQPSSLELITWVKPPNGSFDRAESETSLTVQEGTQVAFIPVPKSADGDRLLGNISFDVSASPVTGAVPVANIWGLYEQSVWYDDEPVSFVFVEPGEVTITIDDTLGQVSGSRTFTVTAIGE